MSGRTRGLLAIVASALCILAATARANPKPVMLQGTSAAALHEQVEAVGGEVTHFLPIIDAVGAQLTTAQVEKLRGLQGVHRIIDDLDREEPEAAPPPCQLGGALELVVDVSKVLWHLYNKSGD